MTELDHLTKLEQLERGLILSSKEFVPKKAAVSKMSSEPWMRREAEKTQLLCIRHHVKITVERNLGGTVRSKKRQAKYDMICEFKEVGCRMCDYQNPDLPAYFHYDHEDIFDKDASISEMVYNNSTMDDIMEEIEKCTIICAFCHRIRTQYQHKEGLIVQKISQIKYSNKINLKKDV